MEGEAVPGSTGGAVVGCVPPLGVAAFRTWVSTAVTWIPPGGRGFGQVFVVAQVVFSGLADGGEVDRRLPRGDRCLWLPADADVAGARLSGAEGETETKRLVGGTRSVVAQERFVRTEGHVRNDDVLVDRHGEEETWAISWVADRVVDRAAGVNQVGEGRGHLYKMVRLSAAAETSGSVPLGRWLGGRFRRAARVGRCRGRLGPRRGRGRVFRRRGPANGRVTWCARPACRRGHRQDRRSLQPDERVRAMVAAARKQMSCPGRPRNHERSGVMT